MSMRWLVPIAAAISRRLRSTIPLFSACSTAAPSSRSLACEMAIPERTIWYTYHVVQRGSGTDEPATGGSRRNDQRGSGDRLVAGRRREYISPVGAVAGRRLPAARGRTGAGRLDPVVPVRTPDRHRRGDSRGRAAAAAGLPGCPRPAGAEL